MSSSSQSTSFGVVLSRIFWMLFGPLLLVLFLYKIVEGRAGRFTALDAAFLAVLVALPVARWIEFQGGDPRTSTGEPATTSHLKRYVSVTLLAGLAVWGAAKLFRAI